MTLIEFVVALCTKGVTVQPENDMPMYYYIGKDGAVWVHGEGGPDRECNPTEKGLCRLYSGIMTEVAGGGSWVLSDNKFLAGEANHDRAVEEVYDPADGADGLPVRKRLDAAGKFEEAYEAELETLEPGHLTEKEIAREEERLREQNGQ